MDFFKLYQNNKDTLKAPEGFIFELISDLHSASIVKWRNDPANSYFFYNREEYTLENQKQFLEGYTQFDRIDFILIEEKGNIPIGIFSIKNLSCRPELGKMLGEKRYGGKGLAKKASYCLLQFAFKLFRFEIIVAETRNNNIANIKLNEKLGFKIIDEKVVKGEEYLIMQISKNELVYE